MSHIEDFDHLKIQLKDIISATENFSPNKLIGHGGFGVVYKGELSLPEGRIMVAFKRLDRRLGQGNIEFWKEITMLSKYRHENLVPLMRFCIEGDERILVYEYASRGSLDRYLNDTSVTWSQRLKICVGAARALNFLHDPVDTQQRVLHRDIKSSNILLDDKWTAKVSDFGLSKVGPANQPQTYLFSNVVGTPGYCDPLYFETGFLSKESDVYSFGVVLFEVMCGKLCYEYANGKITEILVPKWKRCYEEKRLDEIIFHGLKEEMETSSLDSFSAVAYQCLQKASEKRPTMAEIVKELEFALEQQEVFEDLGKKLDFEEMIRIAHLAVAPLSYRSQSQLYTLFLKGFLVGDGKTWISINKHGELIEMISSKKCVCEHGLQPYATKDSRFFNVLLCTINSNFKVNVSTQFLLPNIAYTINLVFKHFGTDHGTYVPFKYRLDDERDYRNSCHAHVRKDGWLMMELYGFTSNCKEHNFRIEFVRPFRIASSFFMYIIEGIEFCPVKL
ncbi:hypothetical protein L1887_40706 [Cichorium endivia]|nr:hypothetical protein L1887_40706 [Cichorium endivia]